MNNKRINLTQLESYVRGHEKKLRTGEYGTNLIIETPPNKPVGPWNKWEGGLVFDLGEKDAMGDSCVPTARLMAAAPELFAELKRSYEKIDKMDEAILSARELLMSYFDTVTLSDDEAAQEILVLRHKLAEQEILDVVKELRKASE